MAKKKAKGKRPPRAQSAAALPVLADWEKEMGRWFDDVRNRLRWPALPGLRVEMPSVDVYEKGGQVVVTAEIPGMSKEDIQVDLSGSVLTIRGVKKREKEVKEQDYYHSERSYGSFARTLTLPAEVDPAAAKATFKAGVLEIRLPKLTDAKKKPVKVAVA